MHPHHPQLTKAQEICRFYQRKFPRVPPLSVDEAVRLQSAGEKVLMVDCRTAEEMSCSMVDGAITLEQLEEADEADLQAATMIVPYCSVGYRSGIVAERLRRQGYENVRNGDGIVLWAWHDWQKQHQQQSQPADPATEPSAPSPRLVVPSRQPPEVADSSPLLLEKSGQPTRVHVFGSMWSHLPPGYQAVTFPLCRQLAEIVCIVASRVAQIMRCERCVCACTCLPSGCRPFGLLPT
mmetsp:Transcript_28147/g.81047  ORF Transcript_28147/g.81047 Transcript_28147/m.81047 type:complete len:237 (-) Transcript_28147:325-1035(-)